jgi:hypothetical protein
MTPCSKSFLTGLPTSPHQQAFFPVTAAAVGEALSAELQCGCTASSLPSTLPPQRQQLAAAVAVVNNTYPFGRQMWAPIAAGVEIMLLCNATSFR